MNVRSEIEAYEWPSAEHLHAFFRAEIDKDGRCFIDGHRVNVYDYQRFNREWSAWYDQHPELHGCLCDKHEAECRAKAASGA